MGLKTYDAKEVALIFAGFPISGFADGAFVTVDQTEDSFSLVVGSDGEGARSKNNNRSATITFTLLQTSESNAFLAASHNIDIRSPNGDGIGPVFVKDNSGNSLYTADKAWVRKPPAAEFGREVGSREWTIESHELINVTAGN